MSDLISVIVPIYNVEEYIKQCIDSILSQSYKNLEIILIDDGSPDNCGVICDMYAEKDNRVVVIHQKNTGVACARNAGLARATGNYIGFVDPDDYIDKRMFEKLVAAVKERNAQIAICGYKTIGLENIVYGNKDIIYTRDMALKLLVRNKIQSFAWNKLYTREMFKNISFSKNKRYEDVRIMHKVFFNANRITLINYNGYFYTIRNDSITGTTRRIQSKEFLESLENRCQDLRNTKFYNDARYGQFISIRRMIYEMINISSTIEALQDIMAMEKEIYIDAKCAMNNRQKFESVIFLKSPKSYTLLRNIAAFIRR